MNSKCKQKNLPSRNSSSASSKLRVIAKVLSNFQIEDQRARKCCNISFVQIRSNEHDANLMWLGKRSKQSTLCWWQLCVTLYLNCLPVALSESILLLNTTGMPCAITSSPERAAPWTLTAQLFLEKPQHMLSKPEGIQADDNLLCFVRNESRNLRHDDHSKRNACWEWVAHW